MDAQAYERRREPERSVLYETVRTHWNTLLAEVAQRTDGGSLPGFVIAEFERYLSCGILANDQTPRSHGRSCSSASSARTCSPVPAVAAGG